METKDYYQCQNSSTDSSFYTKLEKMINSLLYPTPGSLDMHIQYEELSMAT
jgi:hypothetical protein